MKRYEFHVIPLERTREGLRPAEDHHDVIRAHAARGWSLVQVLSLTEFHPPRLELIFSKKGR